MSEVLDDFADVSVWMPVASGEAELRISPTESHGEHGIKLDFDFKGGGGFAVARRELRRAMPPVYTISFRVRGSAPPNRLELKLADVSGRNVWWYRREAFAPPSEWTTLEVRSRELEFAWGPQGGGVISDLGAIEIAVVAPPGGRGTLEVADLVLEDRSLHPTPLVTASRAAPGHEPAAVVTAGSNRAWRSGPTSEAEWLELDLGTEREHGGFVVDWEAGREARDFDLSTSLDHRNWTLVRSVRGAGTTRSHLYAAGGGDARYVRLELRSASGPDGYGVRAIEVAPFESSRSIETFFAGIARREPRGRYPRWLYGEQAYWTPIAAAEGSRRGLLNEDGLLEVARAAFSLEPMLAIDGKLHTWADAGAAKASLVELLDASLPLPSTHWSMGGAKLVTTAAALSLEGRTAAGVLYVLENLTERPLSVTLYVLIRPFQVTPPWQAFRGMGGATRIASIALESDIVWVNDERAVLSAMPPSRFGAASFDQGSITDYLANGELPDSTAVEDVFGYASAALAYDLTLEPDEQCRVTVAVPFDRLGSASRDAVERLRLGYGDEQVLQDAALAWRRQVSEVELELGAGGRRTVDAVKTATCHILTNRYGAALQPGPRRYTRSWIRDGATMAAALLRMGRRDEVRDFIRWYAPYQAADGNVPCCVDERGADWLVEHDSHGQLIFTVMEHYRFARDRSLLEETWPSVEKAVRYIDAMRARRLTHDYEASEKRACYGLLPESVSHEGYLAQPVHSYWDDFWALRGLADASEIAAVLGKREEGARFAASHASLERALYDSIRSVIEKRKLAYVPGSVEWADFDPTATANALQIADAAEGLPRAELDAMFDEYMKGLRRRRDGETDWVNYTAYEIRVIGALVRLGRRDEANELLAFFLADMRPPAWNQWPEISWRDPRSGGHVGDLPHSWIGAEYVLSVLSMLAYERASDGALVLAAGIPDSWLGDRTRKSQWRNVYAKKLPTYFGALDYTLARESEDSLCVTISSVMTPPGGIEVRPPLARPLAEATLDGRKIEPLDSGAVLVPSAPANVVLQF